MDATITYRKAIRDHSFNDPDRLQDLYIIIINQRVDGRENLEIENAQKLFDNGSYSEVISALTLFEQSQPYNLDALALLSHAHLLNNNADEANRLTKFCLNIEPQHPQHRCNEIRSLLKSSDFKKAYEYSMILSELYSKNLEVQAVFGACLRLNKNFERALSVLNNVILHRPNHAEALVNRGLTKLSLSDKDGALVDLMKANCIKPHIREIRLLIVELCLSLQKYDRPINLLNSMVKCDPDNAKLLSYLGLCYHKIGDLDSALIQYERINKLTPRNAKILNNMGVIFQEKNSYPEALKYFNLACQLDDKFSHALNNLGTVHEVNGDILNALSFYIKAAEIDPEFKAAAENQVSLAIQLNRNNSLMKIKDHTTYQTPKYAILEAIYNFQSGEFTKTKVALNYYQNLSRNQLELNKKDKQFCDAYYSFLNALLLFHTHTQNTFSDKIYHIGESHCLSYAHRAIRLSDDYSKIVPLITFGGKAYHFSQNEPNKYKEITRHNLLSKPAHSTFFFSFGEIDCRLNEGIIQKHRKTNEDIQKIILNTVNGYIDWIISANTKQHDIFIFNIPAPIYDPTELECENNLVRLTVKNFNAALEDKVEKTKLKLVDVYGASVNEVGFSNERYHIDKYHLSPNILPTIFNNFEVM